MKTDEYHKYHNEALRKNIQGKCRMMINLPHILVWWYFDDVTGSDWHTINWIWAQILKKVIIISRCLIKNIEEWDYKCKVKPQETK